MADPVAHAPKRAGVLLTLSADQEAIAQLIKRSNAPPHEKARLLLALAPAAPAAAAITTAAGATATATPRRPDETPPNTTAAFDVAPPSTVRHPVNRKIEIKGETPRHARNTGSGAAAAFDLVDMDSSDDGEGSGDDGVDAGSLADGRGPGARTARYGRGATAPSTPAFAAPAFAEEAQQLVDMGFSRREENARLLAVYGGDVGAFPPLAAVLPPFPPICWRVHKSFTFQEP